MEPQRQIVFYDGQAFASSTIACWCRDLLNSETGKQYHIVCDKQGDRFFIERATPALQSIDNGHAVAQHAIQSRMYRQALRSWLMSSPKIMIGLFIVVYPVQIWTSIFQLLRIQSIPSWFPIHTFVEITTFIGISMICVVFTQILWAYYSECLNVTSDGINRRSGILSRKTTSLRYRDIRNIGLQQSIFQRLLGIGTLEFSSAGSGGVEIRFDNIAKPFIIKATIQRRMS